MQVEAHLLGDPDRMPFVGHLQVGIHTANASLAAAGRVAAASGIVPGFRAAREIETALLSMNTQDITDRNQLLALAWSVLADIASCDLGPAAGADLSLLLAARDARGMGIAGVGLSGVWGWSGQVQDELTPLVQGAHPLLGAAGLPSAIPGVLTLDAPVTRVIAAPAHIHPVLPATEALALRCGDRRRADRPLGDRL
jgi:hypothetical protein